MLPVAEAEWGPPAISVAPTFDAIAGAVRQLMAQRDRPQVFVPGVTRIPLNVPTYGADEVVEALDSLCSTYVTMGKKVKRFEEMWADYVGVKYAVMVNSGSSANLLALSALIAAGKLSPGDEIITPALTWATTVFPIAQVGCVPVLVDVDPITYNIDPEAVIEAITPNTRTIMPVHLLGNPCAMNRLGFIAASQGLSIIEDACEAHGAEYQGHKVCSFGDIATFSFFFSHHISTIEGGMVVTNDPDLAQKVRSMRAFGWVRDLPDPESIADQYPAIDPRFLFIHPGYNMRPTEIQGAFGMHQLPRLEGYIAIRRENMAYWNKEFAQYQSWITLPSEAPNTRHVSFAYPITVKEGAPFAAKELSHFLESRGVETRPIESGNMALQPAMKYIPYRIADPLTNAQYIHESAFFWGNHHGISTVEREAIVRYVREFMGGQR